MNPKTATLLVVAVLVAVPMGVFLVARSQAPASRHYTTSYATAVAHLTQRLRRSGYSDIRCGWTGYVNTGPIVVTCTGTRSSGPGSTSLRSIGITIQGSLGG